MSLIEQIKMFIRSNHYKNHENPFEISYIINQVKPGDTVFDIGANKGGFLYWMASKTGKTGKAIAFEPQHFLFNFLRNYFSEAKYPQVHVESIALSDKAEKVTMIIPDSGKKSSPGASIHFTLKDNPTARTEEVATMSLDAYCEQNKLAPALIKIDVEGHELKVIKGGLQTFAKYKPKIILECESLQVSKQNVTESFKLLTDLGYLGFFYYLKKRVALENFDFAIHQPEIFEGKKRLKYVSNFYFE